MSIDLNCIIIYQQALLHRIHLIDFIGCPLTCADSKTGVRDSTGSVTLCVDYCGFLPSNVENPSAGDFTLPSPGCKLIDSQKNKIRETARVRFVVVVEFSTNPKSRRRRERATLFSMIEIISRQLFYFILTVASRIIQHLYFALVVLLKTV